MEEKIKDRRFKYIKLREIKYTLNLIFQNKVWSATLLSCFLGNGSSPCIFYIHLFPEYTLKLSYLSLSLYILLKMYKNYPIYFINLIVRVHMNWCASTFILEGEQKESRHAQGCNWTEEISNVHGDKKYGAFYLVC